MADAQVSLQTQLRAHLRTGRDMLAKPTGEWRMVQEPQPIVWALACSLVDSNNNWVSGDHLVEILGPLKRLGVSKFNPDGWLGKELTEYKNKYSGRASTEKRKRYNFHPVIEAWEQLIERDPEVKHEGDSTPYKYRFKDYVFPAVVAEVGRLKSTSTP